MLTKNLLFNNGITELALVGICPIPNQYFRKGQFWVKGNTMLLLLYNAGQQTMSKGYGISCPISKVSAHTEHLGAHSALQQPRS